jgi:inhibitor of cysteine peptidase
VEVVVVARSRFIVAFVLLLALLSLAACGSGGSGSSDTSGGTGTSGSDASGGGGSDQQSPATLNLSAKDNGGTFVIQTGGTIVLKLESNPSTGYSWEMNDPDPEASLLEQVGEPIFKSDNPDLAGAGGTMTFTFKAADPGNMTVSLAYMPPAADEAPTMTFQFDLTVK